MRVDLEDRLDRWTAEGLLTPEQAVAIRSREREEPAAEGRSALAAEAIGYLGAALALVAAGLVAGRYWDRIELWGRLTLLVTIAVVTFLAGWWVRERSGAAVGRLVSLLWFATAASTTAAAVLAGDELLGLEESRLALFAGGALTLVAAMLYLRRPRPLQQVALLAGVITVSQALLTLPLAAIDPLYHGLALWATGIAWALLGHGGWLVPRTAALVLGGVVTIVGLQVGSVGDLPGEGLGLALATTAAVGVASVAARDLRLLGLAVAGTFLFVPRAVFHYFGDSLGAPFALFLTGVVLIGVAVGSLRVGRGLGRRT